MKPRIATLDGIYVLDAKSGMYEPEREEHYRARGLLLWASMLPGIAAIYGLWAWLG